MKIIPMVISTIVVVVMISSVLWPIVEESQDESDTLDVIFIDGQSNAEYSFSLKRANKLFVDLPVPDEHKLMYYGGESAANQYPYDSSNTIYEMNRDGYWQIGGLEPYLAYYYAERAGHDVLTINVGRGGMSIDWLKPDGEGGEFARNSIDNALSQISGYSHINMVGWVWLQGETDKEMEVDTYKEGFLELREYFDSLGAEDCYIVKTRSYWGGNATIAQDELVEEYSDIYMATTITDTFTEENGLLVSGDPIHYSQLGRNVIGEAVGEYMKVYHAPGFDLLVMIPVVLALSLVAGVAVIIVKGREMV